MRTYRNGQDLRADKNQKVPEMVYIKVDVEILAAMLGHRFVGPSGATVSMEQVDIWEDAEERRTMALPMVIVTSPAR